MNLKGSFKSKGSVRWALNTPFSGDLESLDHHYLTTKHSILEWFLQSSSIINFAFDEWVILHQHICQLSKSPKWWPLAAFLLSPGLGQTWQQRLLTVSAQLFSGAVLTVAGWTELPLLSSDQFCKPLDIQSPFGAEIPSQVTSGQGAFQHSVQAPCSPSPYSALKAPMDLLPCVVCTQS